MVQLYGLVMFGFAFASLFYGFIVVGVSNLEAILALIGLILLPTHFYLWYSDSISTNKKAVIGLIISPFVMWYFVWSLVIMNATLLKNQRIVVQGFTSEYIFSTINNKNRDVCNDNPFQQGC